MEKIFTGEKIWNFCVYWCLLLGLLSTIFGGNILYRQFYLGKKVVMIATNDFPEGEEEERPVRRK